MDLRQLRYFVKVVEYGNVTRASEALHVAQPAVSQQILNLERHLDMQLLERTTQGVSPTAAGRTLYRHAQELLRQSDRTRELLLQDAATPAGRVSVGLPSSTARLLAIPLARAVRERYPAIVLELIEAPTADLNNLISSGRVDLVVAADALITPGIESTHLLAEALYLIAWPGYRLPRRALSLKDLSSMPMILPSSPNTIRSRVEWAMREAGLPYNVCLEASSTALLFAGVMAQLGVTILPWSAAHEELIEGKLKLARINHRLFRRDLSLCLRKTALLSNAVLKVKALIPALMQSLSQRTQWAVRPDKERQPDA